MIDLFYQQRDCVSNCIAQGTSGDICEFQCHGWPDQPSWGSTISYPVNSYSTYFYPKSRCYWHCIGPGLCAIICDGPIFQ